MNKQKQINFIIFLLAFVIIQINSTVYAIQDTPKKQEKNNISLEKIQEKKLVSKIDFDSIWEKAKDHSYDLKIADFNILIAKQDIRGARSEYFPKLIASSILFLMPSFNPYLIKLSFKSIICSSM